MSYTISELGFGIPKKTMSKITLTLPRDHFIWIIYHKKKIISFWILSRCELDFLNPDYKTSQIAEIKLMSEIYLTQKKWYEKWHDDNAIKHKFIGFNIPSYTHQIFSMIGEDFENLRVNEMVNIKFQIGKSIKIVKK